MTNQACAACKFQRRRCNKECLLRPYFPADQPKVFEEAHKLFGVSIMTKLLKDVEPDLRDDAMKSIKYQAMLRSKFPVTGSCEVINQLKFQLRLQVKELISVRTDIQEIRQLFDGECSQKPDFAVENLVLPPWLLDDSDLRFVDLDDFMNVIEFHENNGIDVPFLEDQTQLIPYQNNNAYDGNGETGVVELGTTTSVGEGLPAQHEIGAPQEFQQLPLDPTTSAGEGFLVQHEIGVPQEGQQLTIDPIGGVGQSYRASPSRAQGQP